MATQKTASHLVFWPEGAHVSMKFGTIVMRAASPIPTKVRHIARDQKSKVNPQQTTAVLQSTRPRPQSLMLSFDLAANAKQGEATRSPTRNMLCSHPSWAPSRLKSPWNPCRGDPCMLHLTSAGLSGSSAQVLFLSSQCATGTHVRVSRDPLTPAEAMAPRSRYSRTFAIVKKMSMFAGLLAILVAHVEDLGASRPGEPVDAAAGSAP
mmetsp:Transcript_4157/g.12541  ORF Transcript_4157/g.12541 Transcript_4157/m.12541 type:complete len:208 (-) Transcript_4157:42-665(-)